MMLAAGMWLVIIWLIGSTTSVLGASPKLHCKVAPEQTCIGILHPPTDHSSDGTAIASCPRDLPEKAKRKRTSGVSPSAKYALTGPKRRFAVRACCTWAGTPREARR